MSLVLVPLAALSLAACASSQREVCVAGPPGSTLTIQVNESGRTPLHPLDGVQVLGLSGDGTVIELGKTSKGRITIDKDVLWSKHVRFLIFSMRGFFSGAIRADDPKAALYAGDLVHIDLAPLLTY